MSYKFFVSLLFCFTTAFVCNKPKIQLVEAKYDLPAVDSVNNIQCVVRYKSSLYDNNYSLKFNLRIIYFDPAGLETLSGHYERDSVIVNNLNKSFKTQNIEFQVKESNSEWDDRSINTFTADFEDYVKDGVITILVYSNSFGATFNGIAAGIPHTVMGILESKIGTSTLPHEMAHCFNLSHVFEKDDTDGRNSNTGDKICDTGAFNLMDLNTDSCMYIGKKPYTEEELALIIPNYLNYNSQEYDCRNLFTPVQSLVIRWGIENYPPLYSALAY